MAKPKTAKTRRGISLRDVALRVARDLRENGGVKLKLAMRRKDAAFYGVQDCAEVQTFPDDWFTTGDDALGFLEFAHEGGLITASELAVLSESIRKGASHAA